MRAASWIRSLLAAFCCPLFAQSIEWQTTIAASIPTSAKVESVGVDAAGNVFVAGSIWGGYGPDSLG